MSDRDDTSLFDEVITSNPRVQPRWNNIKICLNIRNRLESYDNSKSISERGRNHGVLQLRDNGSYYIYYRHEGRQALKGSQQGIPGTRNATEASTSRSSEYAALFRNAFLISKKHSMGHKRYI